MLKSSVCVSACLLFSTWASAQDASASASISPLTITALPGSSGGTDNTGKLLGIYRSVSSFAPGGDGAAVKDATYDWTRDSAVLSVQDSSALALASMTQRPADLSFSAAVTTSPLDIGVRPAQSVGNALGNLLLGPHGQVTLSGTLAVDGDAGATAGAAARAVVEVRSVLGASDYFWKSELVLGTASGTFSQSAPFSVTIQNPFDTQIAFYFEERMDVYAGAPSVPVPEPATAALMLVGLGACLRRVRLKST